MKPENQNSEIPEFDPEIPRNAVSLYGQSDAMDDFPVLKAFQQYIDSEQAKARKRMLMLCIFFGVLMTIVITVFLVLLLGASSRNQTLNDRLIEYAMKERERMSSPIVVQPQQPQQDNSAILALTTKLEELQKKLEESREKEEEARRQAELEAAKPKGPTPEEIEIKRLNALLAAEKAKQEAEKARLAAEKEKERQHQIEIEEYRRKHYPEFYEKKSTEKQQKTEKPQRDEHAELMREIDGILEDSDAKTYFEEEDLPKKTRPSRVRKPKAAAPAQKEYSIPVDVRGSSGRWSVPND